MRPLHKNSAQHRTGIGVQRKLALRRLKQIAGEQAIYRMFAAEVQKSDANDLLNSTEAMLTPDNQLSNDEPSFIVQENRTGNLTAGIRLTSDFTQKNSQLRVANVVIVGTVRVQVRKIQAGGVLS